MELLSKELEKSTVVSVGHRPELEAFHSRKIILEHRHGGAKLVSDVYLLPESSGLLDRLLQWRAASASEAEITGEMERKVAQ